ncbi:protein chibby homolog 1-like [Rhopilema esculentum]|uniref:protein chibby homolog 1-like n=1 Tax=Rhopilema esculentum TaxID=499914 RepID=UPI0031D5E851
MPIFKRPSFKGNRKIPERRVDAGATNNQLLDRQSLDPGVDYEQNPVKLNLGGRNFVFSEGDWVCEEGSDSDVATIQSNKEIQRLRKTVKDFREENNLLKYKIELLLDMVAVSNSDLDAMQNELEKLREFKEKTESKGNSKSGKK